MRVIIFFSLLLMGIKAQAQFTAKDVIIGFDMNVNRLSQTLQADGYRSWVKASLPKVHYFLNKNIAIGGNVMISGDMGPIIKCATIGLNANARYYYTIPTSKFSPYLELQSGWGKTRFLGDFLAVNTSNPAYNMNVDVKLNSYTLGGSIGVNYHTSSKIILEASYGKYTERFFEVPYAIIPKEFSSKNIFVIGLNVKI